MQTVCDLITQIRQGFSLLEHIPGLHLELDGYTILEGTSLDLFRDGDVVTVKASQAPLTLKQPEGAGKRRRSEACVPTKTAVAGPEPERPKKRRRLARTGAPIAPSGAPLDSGAVEQLQLPLQHPETHEKARLKRKRKNIEAQQAEPSAETTNPQQPAAGKASDTDADAPVADADSPSATEQKKQSRSARRKQLKRRFRRMGVAPPPHNLSSSSLHQSGALNPAAAPAAVAATPSSSHPGTAQPAPEAGTPCASPFPPPPKRLKTQPGKLRAQRASKGHVYFAESGSESDSADDHHAHHAANMAPHGEEHHSGQDQVGEQGGSIKQKTVQTALPNGLHSSGPKQESKPGPKLPHLNSPHPKTVPTSTQEAGPSMPLPVTDAEYAALPLVEGPLQPGALVGYKLLEIGPDWAPQVSEWRQGEVDSTDASGTVVIKPLQGQALQVQASKEEDEEEEEEEEEGPPSSYDEEGVLTTELSSLSDLRLIKASPLATAPQPSSVTGLHLTSTETIMPPVIEAAAGDVAAVPGTADVRGTGAVPAAAAKEGFVDIGQSSMHQANSSLVPNVGAWAELSHQIAHKKAELVQKAGGSSEAAGGLQGGCPGVSEVTGVTECKVVKVMGMQTPGAARPRGGVRASAMGPMLAFLRSSGGLDSHST